MNQWKFNLVWKFRGGVTIHSSSIWKIVIIKGIMKMDECYLFHRQIETLIIHMILQLRKFSNHHAHTVHLNKYLQISLNIMKVIINTWSNNKLQA